MAILTTLFAAFKFWDQVTWFVQILQKTPEAQHEELMKKIAQEADQYAQGSRPTWG